MNCFIYRRKLRLWLCFSMSHIHLSIHRLRRIFLLLKSHPFEISFIVSLFLATLAPLRCPRKRYSYLNLYEISDDLQMCLASKRSHELRLCPLVSKHLGIHFIIYWLRFFCCSFLVFKKKKFFFLIITILCVLLFFRFQ